LRRNALVAAGNVGTTDLVDAVEPYAASEDDVLRETAEWALDRIAERVS
jgi:epoxyqueuosine reductase QueG